MKIGPKGQIMIPKDIMRYLNLKPGDEVIIEIEDKEIKLKSFKDDDAFLQQFMDVPEKLEKAVDIEHIIEDEYKPG